MNSAQPLSPTASAALQNAAVKHSQHPGVRTARGVGSNKPQSASLESLMGAGSIENEKHSSGDSYSPQSDAEPTTKPSASSRSDPPGSQETSGIDLLG